MKIGTALAIQRLLYPNTPNGSVQVCLLLTSATTLRWDRAVANAQIATEEVEVIRAAVRVEKILADCILQENVGLYLPLMRFPAVLRCGYPMADVHVPSGFQQVDFPFQQRGKLCCCDREGAAAQLAQVDPSGRYVAVFKRARDKIGGRRWQAHRNLETDDLFLPGIVSQEIEAVGLDHGLQHYRRLPECEIDEVSHTVGRRRQCNGVPSTIPEPDRGLTGEWVVHRHHRMNALPGTGEHLHFRQSHRLENEG